MKLAIDTRITCKSDKTLHKFTIEFWRDIAIAQPNHEFILITCPEKMREMPPNVQVQQFTKAIFQWIADRKLKKMLVQWQAGILITTQQSGFTIKKCIKNEQAPAISKRVFFTGSMQAAAIVPAETADTFIMPALPHFITTLTWAESESIKTLYTGGRSFFLFTGNINEQHQLIELLKAFSIFKKWQQSNMQLVLLGNYTPYFETLKEKLLTYKYKEDVVLLKNISNEETAKLVAASYALVYPSAEDVFAAAILWAIQSNKAIITTDNKISRQLTGAAAWVEPNNTADGFAKAMIQLYKDETQLQQLVRQTNEEAKLFSRQQMLAEAWRCMEQ